MGWNDFNGKKVFIQIETINGLRSYSGIINDIIFMGKNIEGIEIWFIELIDKFGDKVGFASNQIKLIQEEK